jgi:hypothetical protein
MRLASQIAELIATSGLIGGTIQKPKARAQVTAVVANLAGLSPRNDFLQQTELACSMQDAPCTHLSATAQAANAEPALYTFSAPPGAKARATQSTHKASALAASCEATPTLQRLGSLNDSAHGERQARFDGARKQQRREVGPSARRKTAQARKPM